MTEVQAGKADASLQKFCIFMKAFIIFAVILFTFTKITIYNWKDFNLQVDGPSWKGFSIKFELVRKAVLIIIECPQSGGFVKV